MKSWEQMKQLTFVNIKLTKAKSISQGLTRCRIQKLSRNNPVYQHLRIHRKKKKLTNCPICNNSQIKDNSSQKYLKKRGNSLQLKIQSNQKPKVAALISNQLPLIRNGTEVKKQSSQLQQINLKLDKIMDETPRRPKTPKQKAFQEGDRMKRTIDKFDKSMRHSKSCFSQLNKGLEKVEGYFMTAIDDIQLQFNEDKGLSLRQAKTDQQKLKEDMNLHSQKMKKLAKRVKQFDKPIIFPFTTKEVRNIVDSDTKLKNSQTKKINRVITNLYEYKSNENYSKRMKMINLIIKQQK